MIRKQTRTAFVRDSRHSPREKSGTRCVVIMASVFFNLEQHLYFKHWAHFFIHILSLQQGSLVPIRCQLVIGVVGVWSLIDLCHLYHFFLCYWLPELMLVHNSALSSSRRFERGSSECILSLMSSLVLATLDWQLHISFVHPVGISK